jgi:hypothetical protein
LTLFLQISLQVTQTFFKFNLHIIQSLLIQRDFILKKSKTLFKRNDYLS